MVRKIALQVVCCMTLAASVFAQQLSVVDVLSDLPESVVDTLIAETEVFRYDRNMIGIKLMPRHPSTEVIRIQHKQLKPDVMVEGLYLIPYPEDSRGIDLDLYNMTRSVSAISKVKYYSARRKAIVPLFDKVYRIEDTRKKKRLEDPLVDSIPAFDSILMHMKEVNLGSGYYETQYVYDGESLGIFFKNISPLRSLIKIVDTENMRINITILPTDMGYLVYGYCSVQFTFKNLVFNMMDPFSAFYKRLFAMVTWVNNSLHESDDDPIIGRELDF